MEKRRPRFVPGTSFVNEALEKRVALSGMAAAVARNAATVTTLSAAAGTLGQPVTFTATVRAPSAAGSPTGTIELLDRNNHNTVIGTLTLAPTTSTNPHFAYSAVKATMMQAPGGGPYYFGKHQIIAQYVPSGGFAKSMGTGSFTVAQPYYTSLGGGVEASTVGQGSGPQIQPGQTASVLYTGYLEKNGKIFDDSLIDGGAPFSFTLGTGQVIPGFDAGVTGMRDGETRAILIPPTEGYGAHATGQIPANSTLVFLITLESISSNAQA
jgi:hypothetical protein